jgi:hypothetical protein
MPLTEDLHRRLPDLDALGLLEVDRQLGIGPIGSIQSLGLWPCQHPLANHGRQVCWELGRRAGGLARMQALQAVGAISVQPALDTAGSNPKVLGNTPVAPSAVGHEDELGTIPEFAVRSGVEYLFQHANFLGGQLDTDHKSTLSR